MRLKVLSKRFPVFFTVVIQLLGIVCLSIVAGFSTDRAFLSIASVCAGGAVAIVALIFGVWRGLWRRHDDLLAERVLLQLYAAELSKLLLSLLLLGLVFKYASALYAGWVIASFALTSLVGAIAIAGFDSSGQAADKQPEKI